MFPTNVPGISGLFISGYLWFYWSFVTLMGIITGDRVNGAARWMTFMGLQFQPIGIGKDGGNHCRLIHPVQKAGRIRSQPECLQIYHDPHRTGIPAYRTGKPFDSNAAFRSSMHDDVYRPGVSKKADSECWEYWHLWAVLP